MSLLIIDVLNVVRRIHEAIPVPDSPEKMVGTIKASLSSLKRALLEHLPTHACFVFDHENKNWRHELYPNYKINRKPTPEHFKDGLLTLKRELTGLDLNWICLDGVEADDAIAALTKKWCETTKDVVTILSTDKDFYSIMNDQVKIYDHFKSIERDEAYVLEKFGVKPSQMVDFLALTGDAADGIPGVEKIGKKTAAQLLHIHGNLDRILSNSDKITGQAGVNLRKSHDIALLSRQLIQFKTDMPLGLTWKMLSVEDNPIFNKPDYQRCR